MALRAATSMLDVLWVLYDRVLRVSPDTISDLSGGLSYLSEGHGPMAYYVALARGSSAPVGSKSSTASARSSVTTRTATSCRARRSPLAL